MRNFPSTVLCRAATVVTAIALFAAAIVASPDAIRAQEGSPEAGGSIPPIVWQLTAFDDGAGTITTVDDPLRYTIQFLPSGSVAIGADCNRGVSDFTIDGTELVFGEIVTTLALCPPESLSEQFLGELSTVRGFSIDNSQASDQLVLSLESGGALWFAPSLVGVVWQWQQFEGGDGTIIAPEDPEKFALEFQADGTVTGQIDCNRGFGSYTVEGSNIAIIMASTRMFCGEGSLDGEYMRFLSESNSFVIRDGKFSLALPMDGGISTFSPVYDDPFTEAESAATPEAGD